MQMFTPVLIAHKLFHRLSEKFLLWYWHNYTMAYLFYRGGEERIAIFMDIAECE